MRFLPANLDALLVELDDLPQTIALMTSLRAHPIRGIQELVPAARTMLIRYEPSILTPAAIIEDLSRRHLVAEVAQDAPLVEIVVDYHGEDLPEVAELLGLTTKEVIERHCEAEYTVAFNGFAPGFSYLSARAGLHVPRRRSPRGNGSASPRSGRVSWARLNPRRFDCPMPVRWLCWTWSWDPGRSG